MSFLNGYDYGYRRAYHPFGSLELSVTSPPQEFEEPMDVIQAATYLNLPPSMYTDVATKEQLSAMITASREQAEILQNRDLVRKQWDLSFDYWPMHRIELRSPLVSVQSVEYRDSDGNTHALIEDTDFVVDLARQPGAILPMFNHTWPAFTPWPTSAIIIRFTSGYDSDAAFWSDAGSRVKMGMRLLVSDWWTRRLPFAEVGGGTTEFPFAVTACMSYGAVPRVR